MKKLKNLLLISSLLFWVFSVKISGLTNGFEVANSGTNILEEGALSECIFPVQSISTGTEPFIDNGKIVWMDFDGHDSEIYLWDNGNMTQITNNETNDYSPVISKGKVVWSGCDINNKHDVYLWDGVNTQKLTDIASDVNLHPFISNDQVVWINRQDKTVIGNFISIYLWKDGIISLIDQLYPVDGYDFYDLSINEGKIVWASKGFPKWSSYSYVFLWENSIRKTIVKNESFLGENYIIFSNPKESHGIMSWLQTGSGETGIFKYENETASLISNVANPKNPYIDNGKIVWSNDNGIFLYYDGKTYQLAKDLDNNQKPIVSNSQVVWSYNNLIYLCNLDWIGPQISIQPETSGQWTNAETVTVSAAGNDNDNCGIPSGIDNSTWKYKIQDGDWNEGTSVIITNEGTTLVSFQVKDNAGNITEKSTQISIDRTPPESNIIVSGNQWSSGEYKNEVTITIISKDQADLSGIDKIYYSWGVNGTKNLYSGQFSYNTIGSNELYVYAIDKAGNIESPKKFIINIIETWKPAYSLLSNGFESKGNVLGDSVFSNGYAVLLGNATFDYLGTTLPNIIKKGHIKINTLQTSAPYQYLPLPDWKGLDTSTTLVETYTGKSFENSRFKHDISINKYTRVKGLLVVYGNIVIKENAVLNHVGIFCTGKIFIAENVQITGLLYAGGGLHIGNKAKINGAIISKGKADIQGTIKTNLSAVQEFLVWLKKQ